MSVREPVGTHREPWEGSPLGIGYRVWVAGGSLIYDL